MKGIQVYKKPYKRPHIIHAIKEQNQSKVGEVVEMVNKPVMESVVEEVKPESLEIVIEEHKKPVKKNQKKSPKNIETMTEKGEQI